MRLFPAILVVAALIETHALAFEGAEKIKSAVQTAIKDHKLPGAVVWIEREGKAEHWAQGQLVLKPASEELKEDTIFDAASLTKVVATTPSVMLLIDQGKVVLDAPLKTYIREFTGEGRDAITVRHLMTHTSGLPPGIPKEPAWTGYDAGIRRACAAVPDPLPGHVFRYSDVNFILLGEVVHRVSGTPLDIFAKEHVFAPLKMMDTRFKPDATLVPRIAPTEVDEKGEMLRGAVHDPTSRKMGGVAGHAGLFTTASDLARYARMMLTGELEGVRLFRPEMLKLMTTPQTPITVYERRGVGWDIDSKFSRPRGKGFPLGSFGHTGFTGTALWIDPGSKSFYVFLSSRLYPDGKGDVRDLYEEVGTLAARALKANGASTIFKRAENEVPTVLNGIDVLKRNGFAQLKGLRLGLITNHTGIDNQRHATIDILTDAPGIKLRALFSPEHGIRGVLDQEKIDDSKDEKTGLPVFSLYGARTAPTAEQMKNLDALVFDIQDMGCRFYTYAATMKNCLEAAAKAGKQFIVLDRVNPVRGDRIEGPVTVAKLEMVACHNIPLMHGMTAGELAQMFNAESKMNAKLVVVQVQGWQRNQWFDATALPWINPSPNMRNLNAASLYPGIGMLEFAISVGRGTDSPFEVIGAPYIDDIQLAAEMNRLGLPGVRFVPYHFMPTTSVFEKKGCGGVRLIITDREALRPVELGLALGHTIHRLYSKDFDMVKFNRLMLDQAAIDAIKNGKPWKEIAKRWSEASSAFAERRKAFLLY
ncbi:MAG: hypothetical protein JWO89_3634 [Verrucomicrobiaceae bacterium]|nr:hypothetical protein [Verrucomicrobiaceae bacterium]